MGYARVTQGTHEAHEIEAPFYFVGYSPRLNQWGVFLSQQGKCLGWHATQEAAVKEALRRTVQQSGVHLCVGGSQQAD